MKVQREYDRLHINRRYSCDVCNRRRDTVVLLMLVVVVVVVIVVVVLLMMPHTSIATKQ